MSKVSLGWGKYSRRWCQRPLSEEGPEPTTGLTCQLTAVSTISKHADFLSIKPNSCTCFIPEVLAHSLSHVLAQILHYSRPTSISTSADSLLSMSTSLLLESVLASALFITFNYSTSWNTTENFCVYLSNQDMTRCIYKQKGYVWQDINYFFYIATPPNQCHKQSC